MSRRCLSGYRIVHQVVSLYHDSWGHCVLLTLTGDDLVGWRGLLESKAVQRARSDKTEFSHSDGSIKGLMRLNCRLFPKLNYKTDFN